MKDTLYTTLVNELVVMPMEDFSRLVAQVVNTKEKEERRKQKEKIEKATACLESSVNTLLEYEDPYKVYELLSRLLDKVVDEAFDGEEINPQ